MNEFNTVRFSFYLIVMPTTKESTVNAARMQRNGGTAFLSLLRLISWSLISGWKEEIRLTAQSPHSKEFLAPAAHEHPER